MHISLAFVLGVAALTCTLNSHAQSRVIYAYKKGTSMHYSTEPPAAGIPFRKISVRTPRKLTAEELQEADAKTAAANAYLDDLYRRGAEELAREQLARERALLRDQLTQQQEQLDELEKRQRSLALQESLRAANQDLQNMLQRPPPNRLCIRHQLYSRSHHIGR